MIRVDLVVRDKSTVNNDALVATRIVIYCLSLSKRGKLLGFFLGHGLGTLVELGLSLETHNTSTPLANQLGIVVVLFFSKILEKVQLSLILLVNTGESKTGSILEVDKSSKTSLVLDNHEWNLHLAAQRRHPHDKFNGIDIAGNDYQFGLLLFNKSSDMLETKLDLMRSLGVRVLARSGRSSLGLDTFLLGGRSLGTVLVEKSKDSHGFVLSKSLGKLVNSRRNLEALVEDGTLTLNAHILGPSHKAREIATARTDITSNLRRTRTGRKERIGLSLAGLGGGCLCLLWCLSRRNEEKQDVRYTVVMA